MALRRITADALSEVRLRQVDDADAATTNVGAATGGRPMISAADLLQGRDRLMGSGRRVPPRGLANACVLEAQAVGRLRAAAGDPSSDTYVERAAHFSAPVLPDMGQPITLTARLIDGQEVVLQMPANARVHMLKSQIAHQRELSVARVKLIHGAEVLQSDRSLAESHIEDGAVVTVIVMPPMYEGSQAYDKVAHAVQRRCLDAEGRQMGEEQVNEVMAQVMDKKMALHDALASGGLLKKRF